MGSHVATVGTSASAALDQKVSRERLMELMLRACGEHGYANVAVERLYSDGDASRFSECFVDKEECFAAGYAHEFGALCERMLLAGRAPMSRAEGLEAALLELACFIEERDAVARSLIAEVHIAGGRALEERARVLGQLTSALDRAYREAEAAPPPPACTAAFMVAAIESVALRACLADDVEAMRAAIPELVAMLEDAYSGD